MYLSKTIINRLTVLKSLLELEDMELVITACSRFDDFSEEREVNEIYSALQVHRFAEASRMIERILTHSGEFFIGTRAGEEREIEIATNVMMTLCWCPPGEFMMGVPSLEDHYCFPYYGSCGGIPPPPEDRDPGGARLHVILSRGFWMAKTQVTEEQFSKIMGGYKSSFYENDNPMNNVSYYDAKEFIAKVNAHVGNADGGKMVLPTEAQWEYACRAGEEGPFSGGTVDQVAWYNRNSGGETHPVGEKAPNAWGLHDMHGNVSEWCANWKEYNLQGGIDPVGPQFGLYRMIRGGSWYSDASSCRAAWRPRGYELTPNYASANIGFRIARTASS